MPAKISLQLVLFACALLWWPLCEIVRHCLWRRHQSHAFAPFASPLTLLGGVGAGALALLAAALAL